MLIRCCSDLHLEFCPIDLPKLPEDHETVLVLAGDIGIASRSHTFMPFLEEMSERFQDVIYVLGNHEHYQGSIQRSMIKIQREIDYVGNIHNIHLANDRTVRIGNVSIICSTLWTSFNKNDPITMMSAKTQMNDYKLIRNGPTGAPYMKKLHPHDTYTSFLNSVNFIFPAIEEEKAKGQTVCVVTHMAPSSLSIHEKYRGDYVSNGMYVSNLEEDILDSKPDVWVHGHVHNSFDYELGETRIICNSRGYADPDVADDINPDLNQDFSPTFRFEV